MDDDLAEMIIEERIADRLFGGDWQNPTEDS